MRLQRLRPIAVVFMSLVVTGLAAGSQPVVAAEKDRPDAPSSPEKEPKGKPIPVVATYRLQVGDEVAIGVLPRPEFDCGGTILPDGTLALKNVGSVHAAGMTLKELTAYVRKELAKELLQPEVTVSLTRLGATPRVTVVGAVVKPGPLDLQEGLRVRKALELAGGSLKEADLSRILLVRNDLSRQVLDLSTEERGSDPKQNPLLENFDSIEVPLRPNKVTVTGAVLKPGPLDLEQGLRLRKAVDLAGGPLKEADLTRVVLIHKDLSRLVVDLSSPELISDPTKNLLLQDSDSIEVPLLPNKVTVGGAVSKPGAVELEKGLRVRKALDIVGGTLKDADLTQVVVTHSDLTRQVVDLSTKERIADPGSNLLLQDGDSVEVPLSYEQGYVGIGGAVLKAARYETRPEMVLEDLIVLAGKLTQMADVEHIQLRRPGKPVETINLLERQKQGLNGKILLHPGDEVYVPELKDVLFLVGAVPYPGPQPLKPGVTLREFFTSGSAFNQRAGFTPDNQQTLPNPGPAAALDGRMVDLTHAQLIRQNEGSISVNLKAVLKNPKSKENVALKSGDVLFLPPRDLQKKKSFADYFGAFQPLYYLFSAASIL